MENRMVNNNVHPQGVQELLYTSRITLIKWFVPLHFWVIHIHRHSKVKTELFCKSNNVKVIKGCFIHGTMENSIYCSAAITPFDCCHPPCLERSKYLSTMSISWRTCLLFGQHTECKRRDKNTTVCTCQGLIWKWSFVFFQDLWIV